MSALTGLAVLVLGVGLAVMFSGGGGWSTDLYLAVAQQSLFELGEVLSTVALLALVAMWAVTATVLLVRRNVRRLITLIIGGCGAVGAYAASEVLKALFTNVRPCVTYDVVTLAACSAAESWSYPSNHTVIGCALAVSLIMAVPRLGLLTVPLAVLVGASRVLSGYHYPHDVLGGAVLGASVVVAVVLMAAPLILSLVRKARSPKLL